MNYKLHIPEKTELNALRQQIDEGYKFIIFQYCISILFAITLTRYSPAILVKDEDEMNSFRKKYNRQALLLGLWAIPWGIIKTLDSIKVNKKGGIDVTEDIMINLDAESLQQKEVNLAITTKLFVEPNKSELKGYRKAVRHGFEKDYNVKTIAAGLYINVEEHAAPHRVVGIKTEKDFDKCVERLEKSLYRYFIKNTYFEFVDLDKDEELCRRLLSQGEIILQRPTS